VKVTAAMAPPSISGLGEHPVPRARARVSILLALLIILTGLSFHATSQPSFCGTCHEMNDPYLQSWEDSIHAPEATCVSCHVGKGLMPLLQAKATRSFHDLYAHFISGFETPIRQTHPVKDSICLECHEVSGNTLNNSLAKHDLHSNELVPCIACHAQTGHAPADQAAALASDPVMCESCHEAHLDFPLIGGHASIECGDCHRIIGYRVEPQLCDICHNKPNDHLDDFSLNCDDCHDVQSWKPARFEEHNFPLDHESQTTIRCDTCHPDNWETYSCYLCHEHERAKVEDEHREEGITDFQDCVGCHPTGREH